jgi:hypothetical protein
MIGGIGVIFVFLPESPWWLASKGKLEKAAKILHSCNGQVEGYDVQEQIVSSNTKEIISVVFRLSNVGCRKS